MRKRRNVLFAVTVFAFVAAIVFTANFICKVSYSNGWNDGYEKCDASWVQFFEEQQEEQQKNTVELKPEKQVNFEAEASYRQVKIASDTNGFKDFEPEEIAPVQVKTEKTYTDDDLFCLAAVIYQEAGADYMTDDLRRKVADVVLNRVADERYPDSIREVLEDAPNGALQYGRFAITGVRFPDNADEGAKERAYMIAEEVLCGNHTDLYGNGYICQAEFVQGTEGFWQEGIYFAKW